ncbi:arylesterase [Stenotrophomonas sp. YIM B06876]|uniref:arylesterase n=1 Tax=Stenotrophomonas sp. YIM B06876 TaxID=3060211 RepID=UPI002739E0E6|nr:arylesterase [Stenotrophomonas sp. YIM B06876]
MSGTRTGWAGRIHRWGWTLLLLALPLAGLASPAPTRTSVLVVGDSLSAAHNIPAASGWVNLLDQRVQAQLQPAPAIVNASVSGETTSGALTRLPALLQKHRPKVVVIELGGNDALRGLSPAQLRSNLDRMVVLSADSGARVLLLGIDVPPNYGPVYRQRLRQTYVEVARRHGAALVPFFLEGVALQPSLMQADGLHPTAAAQPRLLDNVWPVLRPLLKP